MPAAFLAQLVFHPYEANLFLVPLAGAGVGFTVLFLVGMGLRKARPDCGPLGHWLPWLGFFAGAATALPFCQKPVLYWPAAGVIGALTAGWMLASYRQTTRPVSRIRRGILLFVRLALAGVVLGLLFNPAWENQARETQRPLVLLLQDTSASMATPDGGSAGPTLTRYEACAAAWIKNDPALQRLAARADVLAYQFGQSLQPVNRKGAQPDWPAAAAQHRTALSQALRDATEQARRRGRPVAGVILVSDGGENVSAPTSPRALGAFLSRQGTALITIGVGAERPTNLTRGLSIRNVQHQPRGAIGRTMSVRADVQTWGLARESIRVRLAADSQTVAEQVITPEADHQVQMLVLAYTPERLGRTMLTITAESQSAGEEILSARAVSAVQIGSERTRVLAVEVKPRHEFATLIRALSANERVELKSQLALATEPGVLLSRYHLPGTAEGWKRYDVILLGDIPASCWGPGQLAGLVQAVREGRGLVMLGGLANYASYAPTPLEALLPIKNLADTGQISVPLRLQPAPGSEAEPLARLNPDGAPKGDWWSKLPALPGAVRFPGVKTGAKVLLTATAENDCALLPMAVWQQYGAGQVLALAGDQFWTWQRNTDNGGPLLERFWNQVVLQVLPREGEVWVTSSQQVYELDDLRSGRVKVLVEAGVSGANADDAGLTVRLRGPRPTSAPASGLGTEREVTLTGPAERKTGSIPIEQTGFYELTAAAEAQGKKIGESQADFQVVETDVEAQDRATNFELLRELALPTQPMGGGFLPLRRLGEGLDRLAGKGQQLVREHTRQVVLIEQFPWWIFALVLTLLGGEWLLRKRWGLV